MSRFPRGNNLMLVHNEIIGPEILSRIVPSGICTSRVSGRVEPRNGGYGVGVRLEALVDHVAPSH